MDTLDLLISICEKAGLYGEARIKTGVFAKSFFVSQQTISNELRRIESEGLITRKPFNLGINVSLTEKGRNMLESYRKKLEILLKAPSLIKGRVFSGLGEGKFYVMQKGYMKQFESKLDIKPYPGTLNLKVSPQEAKKLILGRKPVVIEGFFSNNRTFGQLNAYHAKANGLKSVLILPKRTHYKDDTFELISSYHLRKKLKLNDGDHINISLEG